jgi:vacuolar protein sorting-associated protein 13A/C
MLKTILIERLNFLLQVKDINLVIGMDMVRGETIIQDVEGLSFELRRSLRDLRHQLPAVEAAIKVAHLL